MSLTTTPTSWLESLPTEILQNICAHFCHHCQGKTLIPQFHLPVTGDYVTDRDTNSANAEAIRDLCALSRVSRRLREVAQPILYHEFPSLELRRGRLEHYLRTVIARPDLAAVVKTLAFNLNIATCLDASLARSIYLQGLEVLGTDVDKVWSSRCEDPLPPKLLETFRCFLFGNESHDESTVDPMALNYFACFEILVLLLSLLPNLTTLSVDGAFISATLSPSAFKAFGIKSIKLKRLYASSVPRAIVDVAHDLDELIIGPRFEVRQEPKPRSISYCLSPEHKFPGQANPIPHALDPHYLEKSFAFYKPPLQSFRFELHGIKPNTRLPRPSFSFLNNFHTTLQSLHLDFPINSASGATIGSLKKFVNLKDVFLASNLIYHNTTDASLGHYLAMFLPENIERFTLLRRSTSLFANNNIHLGIAILAMMMGIGIFPHMTLAEFLCEGTTRGGARIHRLEGNKIRLDRGGHIPTKIFEIPGVAYEA
ncbi:hypothetical protein F52700_5193 [Fusarium sp. NRRL 52700]|nr:hypothetical protein F52700_5193 [Fusarium sp. NRRL 52700]